MKDDRTVRAHRDDIRALIRKDMQRCSCAVCEAGRGPLLRMEWLLNWVLDEADSEADRVIEELAKAART